MAILINNGNIKDIFNGQFEEGSEGKNPVVVKKPLVVNEIKKTTEFRGYIRKSGAGFSLEIIRGGVFTLLLKNNAGIDLLINEIVTVNGVQVADTITDGVINNGQPLKPVEKKYRVKFENKEELKKLATAVKKFIKKYKGVIDNLLAARPGYKYIDGQITKIPAIVAIVEKKINAASLDTTEALPDKFENYDVEVVSASPKDLLIHKYAVNNAEIAAVASSFTPTYLESLVTDENKPGSIEAFAEVLETTTNYIPPSNVELEEVTAGMTLLCHVSPEGGWKTLGPFLDDTTDHLQIAMYDFSAPHIYKALKAVARRGASIKLVYDGNSAAGVGEGTKTDDEKEDTIINGIKKIAGRNFEYVKAWKGNGGICANAYHIKVAVKDQKEFWLSSGNMQTSNQPNEDFDNNINLLPKYNREWNIVVSNKKLSDIYQKFIEWDFERSQEKPETELAEIELPDIYLPEAEPETREVSRYMLFPPKKFVFTKTQPVKIQPVLSPDNYMEEALKVIRSAQKKLYFQNQYIKINAETTPEYEELLNELKDKSNDDSIDCKIILRDQRTDDTKLMLDNLQAYGFNMACVRMMANTHTKGIIADTKIVMIGSHNWSNAGVQYNRDASLVIYNEGVAQYYEDVLLHDWERRTKKKQDEETAIIPLPGTEAALLDDDSVIKLDWKSYLEQNT